MEDSVDRLSDPLKNISFPMVSVETDDNETSSEHFHLDRRCAFFGTATG